MNEGGVARAIRHLDRNFRLDNWQLVIIFWRFRVFSG
jgi:hypothetical protein